MLQLKKIAITGYKGICNRIEIHAKSFNVIIGQNDAGKSTILKALDLFLNNKQYVQENLNNQTAQFTIIELMFETNSTQIIIDESVATTFESEELLNENDLLHIIKKWDGTKEGKITPEYFIRRKSYIENDIFNLSEKDLIRLSQEFGIEAIQGIMTNSLTGEQYNNVEKRFRLRTLYVEQNQAYEYIDEKLPSSGATRLKKTEGAIKKCLPKFEYFPADSSLSESDSAIQKTFKEMALNVIDNQINITEIETIISSELQVAMNIITNKINTVVSNNEQIRAKIDFDWSKIISTSFESDGRNGSVPLSSRGDGFRRIAMMAYFEYLAEERRENHQNIIFGFEEPETFLHPSAQENLFDKLYGIAQSGYQIFLTSHSPVLVSRTQKSDLHHVSIVDSQYCYNPNIEDYRSIADDLGITVDNQFISLFENARCLFLVEGIDDCIAIEHLFSTYYAQGEINSTLEDLGIVTIPVGGCGSIKHWVSLDLLRTLDKPYFILLDSDKTEGDMDSPNRSLLLGYGLQENDEFVVTRKRELENYMLPHAIERLVPGSSLQFTDWCDVKKISKESTLAARLGGKRILEKHFRSLRFNELQSAFNPNGNDDEFISIFNKLQSLAQ